MTKPRKADPKAEARRERIAKARQNVKSDELPQHADKAERAALGCVLLAGAAGSQAEADAMLHQLRGSLFYDLRHRTIFEAMVRLRMENHALDTVTLFEWLKDKGQLEHVGGLPFIADLPDDCAGLFAFGEYLGTLKDKAHRRWLKAKADELGKLADEPQVTLEDTKARLSELFDATTRATSGGRAELKLWRFKELMEWKPNPKTFLVGDNEIRTGYDSITIISGPGSSGKSQTVSALALAGAMGVGLWMGRKVHRQFRTLIIQAENGAGRLKKELETIAKNHPKVDLQEWVIVSDPPEGGIAFHRPEFRAALRRQIDTLKPDLVVIDPWSAVAAEDKANEVVDKLVEIRSCFPSGDDCPGLLIVAHTNKPRADVVRKGRGLMYLVSGSIALVNTARCVYVLLPWSDDMEDDRIYWACPKLNDGQNYAASVWKRRFGNFPLHDDETDPTTWGDDGEQEDRRTITREMIEEVFRVTKRPGMKRSELVRELVELSKGEVASSTAWRALGASGYAREWVDEVAGVVALKKGGKE